MIRFVLALALALFCSQAAQAQCSGVFSAGDGCGNSTAAGALATNTPASSLLSRSAGTLRAIYAASYGVVCDGATNNDTALAAISTAIAAGGFDVILPSGDCRYTAWDVHGLTNIRIEGVVGFSINSTAIGTALTCTRTDAAVCFNAKDTKGFVISNVTMIKADAHTGIVVDMSSTASTWNKNKIENVEFRRLSGSGMNGTALYVRNTVDLHISHTRFSHVSNGLVGGFDGETTTATASISCFTCDFTVVTTAVRNPGPFWSFFGGNWEITAAGVPSGLISQATDTVKSIGFFGVIFADATAAGTWMTFNGGVWGFTMSGGSMSGITASTNGILFAGAAAGTQAVSITGVNFATLAAAITFTGSCSSTVIAGNVFTSVTNRVVNGSGSCYTSNWWPANAPSAFNNAVSGSVYNGQSLADPLWTRNPVLGAVGAIGTLGFLGGTSGTATITPQAAAGSPTLTLPNASGTFAVSASSPLSLSATTGALTFTGAALTKTDDTNITLTLGGSPATALANAASITVGWSGTLAATRGGFGSDVSGQSGVPLFAAGVPTFTGTSGSGNFARVTSPTFVTPTLGAALATSINGLGITSSTGTLTIANLKTVTFGATLTLNGTDATTMTFPSVSASLPGLAIANTFTATQTENISQAAQTAINVINTNASTSASAAFVATSNSGAFTASAGNNPNTTGQAGFTWTGASGMLFAATHASGPLIFDTGGFNERFRVSAAGAMSVGTTTDPGAPGIILLTSYLQTGATTVAGLPACGAGTKGARHFVTDANAATFLTAAAGGGANNVPVVCDGTSWKIGAAANDNDLLRKVA